MQIRCTSYARLVNQYTYKLYIHSSIISHRQINSECLCITKAALVSLYCADQELPLQTWGPCLL